MSKAIYIVPETRISTETLSEFEQNIKSFIANAENDVWIDFSNVQYITSVGLRVIFQTYKNLALQKRKMHLFNVNSTVTQILESTGFSNFILVEAYYDMTYFAPAMIDRANHTVVEEELSKMLEKPGEFLFVNLEDTITISFEGLSALLKADKRAANKGKKLILRDVSVQVLDSMKNHCFLDLFAIEK